MSKVTLDEIDHQILDILIDNTRIPFTDISKRLLISAGTVHVRVKKMEEAGVAQVRVVPATGAERFAQFVYDKVSKFIEEETNGRVSIAKVEFREHNKNAAIYVPR